jgi:D-tagatose-1,6-bisphosphate aldolase subunit GatZ/KbaZ
MSKSATSYLLEILSAQKQGKAAGVMSVCSANRFVIEAAMHQSRADGTALLVESTANQVNPSGGYSGMTPEDFSAFIRSIARDLEFPEERILLGGDHIGPGPWQDLPAETAMGHALDLVKACIEAGYGKIHLDTSMACADDPETDGPELATDISAQRAALLCRTAETVSRMSPGRLCPLYVIGTDVPPPGGLRGDSARPWVSRTSEVNRTISETQKSFTRYHLEDAWDRTVAVVVQPGADFGPEKVVAYDRNRSERLVARIKSDDKFIFEAHATDYQSPASLKEMVADGFAILKVGPALTYAFREAITALSIIETELFSGKRGMLLSNLRKVVEKEMDRDSTHWVRYHPEESGNCRTLRYYSFSDRVRYYWARPKIEEAIQTLLANLRSRSIPLPLLSQYLPDQYEAVCRGELDPLPEDLIRSKIMEVTARYSAACRDHGV